MEHLNPSRLDCLSLMKSGKGLETPSAISTETARAITGGAKTGAYMVSEVHVDALKNEAGLPVRAPRTKIIENYDPNMAGIVVASLHTGSLQVIDGFRRIASARAAGYSHVLCGILQGIPDAQMARMRLAMNANTGLPARTKFALAVIASRAPETAIEGTLLLNGMSAAGTFSTRHGTEPEQKLVQVAGTGELLSIMADPAAGKPCLDGIVEFLNGTGWKALPMGTSSNVMKGLRLAWVSINAQGLLDRGWPALIKSMRNEMPKHALFTARKHAMELPGHTVAERLAEVFVKIMLNAQYGKGAFDEEP